MVFRIRNEIWMAMTITLVLATFAHGEWKTKGRVKMVLEYDNNVFNMSPSQQQRFQANDPADEASGRYEDMEDVGDFMIVPSLAMEARGRGMFGKKAKVGLALGYEQYLRNTRKSRGKLGVAVTQSLPKGIVKLKGSYIPRMFKKNYLVDGIAAADGSVHRGDRIYDAGICSKWRIDVGYSVRVVKKKKTGLFGVVGKMEVGMGGRDFDESHFRGRDRDTRYFGVGVEVDFKKGWEIGVRYLNESADSPVAREVLLLDEYDFGEDFNGDGDSLDANIRQEKNVDRSYSADGVDLTVKGRIKKRIGVSFGIGYRKRDFSSSELYDGYRGRDDKRWEVNGGVDYKIRAGLHLVAGCGYVVQRTSGIDVTGDVVDYRKFYAGIGIIYRWW